MSDRPSLCILLVGASGVFGSRLAERLALEPGIALTLAGRRREPLEVVRKWIGGGAVRTLDRDWIEARDLAGYDLVIDAAGPFQQSGTRLVEAAIEAGVDYVDLSDGRDWVVKFAERFDGPARERGVRLIAGASSIPALSHAVLDRLTGGWSRVDDIRVGISPGNRAPRGLAVVEAILSYAGKAVRVFRDGGWTEDYGWGVLHRVDSGPAGLRWASICDTPDQDLLVARYRPTQSAQFFAGLELSLLHLGLWILSLPVRRGWLVSLRPWAAVMLRISQWLLPFGSDRGAMLVDASGLDAKGNPVRAGWRLSADANRGPYVPVLAAVALARRWREGKRPGVGARACAGILDLDEFAADFDTLGLRTSFGPLGASFSDV